MDTTDTYTTKVFSELKSAVGTIEARADQQERLEEFTSRVSSSEFHITTAETIPSACIDGRCGCDPRPNAAGGTNSLVVAADLTNEVSKNYLDTYDEVLQHLVAHDLPIGGHDDEGAGEQKSGCGACDRLEEIYAFIANNGDTIRFVAESLGVVAEDSLHTKIIDNASVRNNFASGPAIKTKLENKGGRVDHLRGGHNEVVAVINTKISTTLDRNALEKEFGPNYEAFNVDVWSFPEAASTLTQIGTVSSSIEEIVIAMVYYNLATAHVLCGPNMRVVVL